MKRREFLLTGGAALLSAAVLPRIAKAAVISNSDGTFTITGLDPTGQSDCSADLNTAINSLWQTYGGAKLWLPGPGNYRLDSTLYIRGSVMLIGHGQRNTLIGSTTANQNAVILPSEVAYGGMRDLFVTGYQGANTQQGNAVTVDTNGAALIQNCHIWGGSSALFTKGVDSVIENCFISGWGLSCILSTGANWYKRCKVDTGGNPNQNPSAGFYQSTNVSGIKENTFSDCDFSGSFSSSVIVNDSNMQSAVTSFSNCIMSSAISLQSQKSATFTGCKFGSSSFSAPSNTATVVGCAKYGSAMMLPAGVVKAGNVNIF